MLHGQSNIDNRKFHKFVKITYFSYFLIDELDQLY